MGTLREREASRSHGKATAAIGQGDLWGEFQAPGKGPPEGRQQRRFPRCEDGATAKQQQAEAEPQAEAEVAPALGVLV